MQNDTFARTEGDRWFQRNRNALESFNPDEDKPLSVIRLAQVAPASFLEIGGANGVRAAAAAELFNCDATVVDVSNDALADGRIRFPNVQFVNGHIDRLPLDGSFDVVVVNFVLHWVDRENLLAALASVDRAVADGGHLVIGDFHTDGGFIRKRYHHRTDVEMFTYKQDYGAVLLASGMYRTVCRLVGGHAGTVPSGAPAENDLVSYSLYRKRSAGYYRED